MDDAGERLYERLLVVRCQTRDPAAITELIERYSPRLRFYLCKMRGAASVDDLLQDVWIDAFASLARLSSPEAFAAWIYRIARRKAFKTHRPRHQALPPDLEVTAPEDNDWAAEDAQAVRMGLDALPTDHREVLILRFIEDMSYDEIATIVGCPVGTVRSRIFYGKATLRTFLERTFSLKEHCHERQSSGQGHA